MNSELQIELRPLVGKHRAPDGTIKEVAINVDQVLRDGRQIGTIGRFTDAPFCPLAGSGIGRDEAADIVAKIAMLRNRCGAEYGPPREHVVIPPHAVPEQLDGEDDDE